MAEVAEYSPVCPLQVARPLMYHRWDVLTFVHWSYEPSMIVRLLPPSLEIETFDNRAWVGLVPFAMQVRAGIGPRLPWLSNFYETNVRTYVRDARGRSGVWFFSLDAARLPAVVAARAGFRLPYFWSHMRLQRRGRVVEYASARRWPEPRPARLHATVEVGVPYEAGELGALDHFLTARWRLFSVAGGRHRYADAQHDPWPLYRARLLDLDDTLLAAAGIPASGDEPLVHYSPGVGVRIGPPRKA